MKPQVLSPVVLLLLSCVVTAQNDLPARRLLPFLDPDSQTNIVILQYPVLPKPAPRQFVGLTRNTDLFSAAEETLLQQVQMKYRHVTPGSGLAGAVVVGSTNSAEGHSVRFQHTNSSATDTITFATQKSAQFRTEAGRGVRRCAV